MAYYDDYEWAGSLPIMEPGIGYMLKSTTARQFSYPAVTVVAARAMDNDFADEESQSVFKPVNFRKYANNAIMTVRIVANGKALGHSELGVFADDECRTAAQTNEEGVAYLTIPGDDEVTLTFKVAVGDSVKAGQALFVLEAMKMENDVNSPTDGKVLSINTTKGTAVETGTVLAVVG